MDRIAIEPMSHLGLPPRRLVELVSDLKCRYVSVWMDSPGPINAYNHPPSSLRNPSDRREMISAMNDRGVSISLIDGFMVLTPETDVDSLAGDLEIAKELNVPTINTACFEFDLERAYDRIAKLVEMADAVGITTVVEFAPETAIPDLAGAVTAVKRVGHSSCRLLIDMMHLVRSGGMAKDIAALDPKMIGYVHLCDATIAPAIPQYLLEAISERLIPGKGEFPLQDIVSALPRDVIIGLEIPSISKAQAGISPYEHLEPAVEAARRLLANINSKA